MLTDAIVVTATLDCAIPRYVDNQGSRTYPKGLGLLGVSLYHFRRKNTLLFRFSAEPKVAAVDQLAGILSYVDIKERMSSCSLVSSAWRTAAARATTSITYNTGSGRFPPYFQQWLRSHSAEEQVRSLTLFGYFCDGTISLPLAQLKSLESLTVEALAWEPGPEAAYTTAQPCLSPNNCSSTSSSSSSSSSSSAVYRQHGLEQLTALTSLTLTRDSVRLKGLRALTGLRELACELSSTHGADLAAAEDELIGAFPNLQCLTSLTLQLDIASAAVTSYTTSLQSLQKLVLFRPSADSLAALPTALTQLDISFSPTPRASLTHGTAAALSLLTALQSLHLKDVELDWSLLASMHDMRELEFVNAAVAPGGGNMQALSCLTALTSFTINSNRLGTECHSVQAAA